jgi:hypothetical protein
MELLMTVSAAKYRRIIAGYSRSFASGGLEAFIRDVDKLNKPRIGPPSLSYRSQ